MIGEVADGVHVHPLHSIRYIEEVVRPAIATGAARAGRDAERDRVRVPAAHDRRRHRRGAREVARAGAAPARVLRIDAHLRQGVRAPRLAGNVGAAARAPGHAATSRAWRATVTDEMLAVLALETSWDGLADGDRRPLHGIADRVVCYFATASWERHPPTRDRWAEVARAVTRR